MKIRIDFTDKSRWLIERGGRSYCYILTRKHYFYISDWLHLDFKRSVSFNPRDNAIKTVSWRFAPFYIEHIIFTA